MALTGRAKAIQNLGRGQGFMGFFRGASTATETGAAVASGNFTLQLDWNALGSSLPGTIQEFLRPTAPPAPLLLMGAVGGEAVATFPGWFGIFYQVGTVNLASTGNQLTHDSATFPVTRTRFGVTAQPITLLPIIWLTTATATTAPQLQLQTNAGAAGYVNQDGTGVIGTTTFTFPAAATLVQSAYFLRPNSGDAGIRDITQANVTVAGSAGAATIFGFEPLATFTSATGSLAALDDTVYNGLAMCDLRPAVATAGTATAYLGTLFLAQSGANAPVGFYWATLAQ